MCQKNKVQPFLIAEAKDGLEKNRNIKQEIKREELIYQTGIKKKRKGKKKTKKLKAQYFQQEIRHIDKGKILIPKPMLQITNCSCTSKSS